MTLAIDKKISLTERVYRGWTATQVAALLNIFIMWNKSLGQGREHV